MGQRIRKVNIPMCLACVLLCLTLISMHLTGGLLARYVTEAEGSDSARVAGFNILTSGPEGVEIQYSEGDSGDYILTVDNKSEVAISYTIKVVVDPVDFGIRVKLGDQELNTNESTALTVTAPPLAPGGEATHELTFTVVDWGEFTKFVNSQPNRTHELSFTVSVDAVQID